MNYSLIRSDARARLKGNWGTAVLTVLVFGLLTSFTEGLGFMSDFISLFATIAFVVLYGPLQYGFHYVFTKLNRGQKTEMGDMFVGFNSEMGNKVSAGLSIYVYTFLWSLLFIIPGIVASYSYSMTYFIMIDNPKITSAEAIKKSKEMMKGHKMELFCLDLTFIGWMILGILSLGIGMLWVSAYMTTAKARFYEAISGSTGEVKENAEEETEQDSIVRPVSEVDRFNGDNDANVIYRLKCDECGATDTHTDRTSTCPYCGGKMKEQK